MLLLMLPGLVFYLLFYYIPLLGNVVAFEQYLPFLGFVDSPFVGLGNFQSMLQSPDFWLAAANTVATTLLRPSTAGPPEFPDRTRPRSAVIRRRIGPAPYASWLITVSVGPRRPGSAR